MYELNNKVRLIDMSDYDIQNSSEFLGFLSGVVSQDNDLERMYLDSFIKISRVTDEAFADVMARLKDLGEKYNVSFVLSVSKDEKELPESVKEMILVSI